VTSVLDADPTQINAAVPIVVERPIYVNTPIAGSAVAINDGHNTLGYRFNPLDLPVLPGVQPPGPPASHDPAPAFHLDDQVDWGEIDDTQGNGVTINNEVTQTLRIANGLPGQAGYTRTLVPSQPFLTGTATPITTDIGGGVMGDDENTPTALPFVLPFFGIPYDTAFVSTNGWLGFGNPAEDYWDDSQNSDFRGPEAVWSEFYRGVMPYWSDLGALDDLAPGLITKTVAAGNAAMAIQYEEAEHGNAGVIHTFEAVLYPDGRIRFDYRPDTSPTMNSNLSVVGISGGNGVATLDSVALNVTATPTSSVLYVPNPIPPTAGPAPVGTVTTTLAAGTTFVRADSRCTLSIAPTSLTDGLVTCATPVLAVGDSDVFKVVWRTPAVPRSFGFDGAYQTDGLRVEDRDELNLAGHPSRLTSSFTLKKVGPAAAVPVSSEVTFTITATASSVFINPVLTDTFPAGLTFIRSSFDNCTVNASTLTCRPLSGFRKYVGTVTFLSPPTGGTTLENRAGWLADNAAAKEATATITTV
jgi:hypothetical protein